MYERTDALLTIVSPRFMCFSAYFDMANMEMIFVWKTFSVTSRSICVRSSQFSCIAATQYRISTANAW
jgi:hypothetical protein